MGVGETAREENETQDQQLPLKSEFGIRNLIKLYPIKPSHATSDQW